MPDRTFVGLLAAALFFPTLLFAQWKTPWTYAGADHWSDLDPAYSACNSGREQSPIDIRHAQKADLPTLTFDYHPGPLEFLIDNGYTLRVNYHDTPGAGNFLLVGNTRYHLTQFHFHHPSEEYFHGKPFAMEVHLMHESADGKVVGVAVPLRAGSANPAIRQIWEHAPVTKGHEQSVAGVVINPASLLPRNLAYYRYAGSLTAPPCTEGVTWLVLRTPVEMAPAQIDAFARLYPHDVRPVQLLNGRTVQESR